MDWEHIQFVSPNSPSIHIDFPINDDHIIEKSFPEFGIFSGDQIVTIGKKDVRKKNLDEINKILDDSLKVNPVVNLVKRRSGSQSPPKEFAMTFLRFYNQVQYTEEKV